MFVGGDGWLENEIFTALRFATQCPFFLFVKVGLDERQNFRK